MTDSLTVIDKLDLRVTEELDLTVFNKLDLPESSQSMFSFKATAIPMGVSDVYASAPDSNLGVSDAHASAPYSNPGVPELEPDMGSSGPESSAPAPNTSTNTNLNENSAGSATSHESAGVGTQAAREAQSVIADVKRDLSDSRNLVENLSDQRLEKRTEKELNTAGEVLGESCNQIGEAIEDPALHDDN